MKAEAFALAGASAVGIAATAVASLVGTSVENLGDIGAGANTYRLYLQFDNDRDHLLVVAGDADNAPLIFSSDTDLIQNCSLEDSIQCDSNAGLDLGGDSWVNIGEGVGETGFTPNFLDGDGVRSVIKGNYFEGLDSTGYFDPDPGSPVYPDEDGNILIAQFTLSPETTLAYYIGTASYVPGAADGLLEAPFFITIVDSCPGDLDDSGDVSFEDLLILLAAWGPCDIYCFEDLDGSGHVSFNDLLILLAAWGPCE